MNILILSPVFPYPPDDGDKIRIFNIIKRLSKKHKIYLLSFIQKTDKIYFSNLKKYIKFFDWVEINKFKIYKNIVLNIFNKKPLNVNAYYDKRYDMKLKKIIKEKKIDCIFVYRLRMSQYVENIKNFFKVIDIVDSLSFYIKNRNKYEKNLLHKLYLKIDEKRVFHYEKELERKYKYIFINSEIDKNFLKLKNIIVIPNGVDKDLIKEKSRIKTLKADNKNFIIGFFGNMIYPPNKEGIVYFYKNVWKKIKEFDKNIKMIICGKNSDKLKIKDENIKIKGYIENLDLEIKTWDLAIIPVRYGAGRQNKILKCWINKVPVLTTSFAAEGVYGKHKKNLLIYNNDDDILKYIIEIRRNKKLKDTLIKNGIITIKKFFNWNNSIKKMEKYLKNNYKEK